MTYGIRGINFSVNCILKILLSDARVELFIYLFIYYVSMNLFAMNKTPVKFVESFKNSTHE